MASKHDSPFRYPKTRHHRRFNPPKYKRYQSYKQHLRPEFEQKCIYCRRPDSIHPYDYKNFAVEHYKPQELFPDLGCDYYNLFYSCSNCNSCKSDYWPTHEDDPFFPNPCDHQMMDHVRFVGGEVQATSRHGDFMKEALYLNEESLVKWRQSEEMIIRTLEKEIAEFIKLKKKVVKKMGKSKASTPLAELDDEIEKRRDTLNKHCGKTL